MGFTGEVGPVEWWDVAGVEGTVASLKKEGNPVSAAAEKLVAAGKKSWYIDDPKGQSGRAYFDLASGDYKPVQVADGVWSVQVRRRRTAWSKRILARRSSIWAMVSAASSSTAR